MRLTVYLLWRSFCQPSNDEKPLKNQKRISRGPIKLSDRQQWLALPVWEEGDFLFVFQIGKREYQNGRNCVNPLLAVFRERERAEEDMLTALEGTLWLLLFCVFLLGQLARFQVSGIVAFRVYSVAKKEGLRVCGSPSFTAAWNVLESAEHSTTFLGSPSSKSQRTLSSALFRAPSNHRCTLHKRYTARYRIPTKHPLKHHTK